MTGSLLSPPQAPHASSARSLFFRSKREGSKERARRRAACTRRCGTAPLCKSLEEEAQTLLWLSVSGLHASGGPRDAAREMRADRAACGGACAPGDRAAVGGGAEEPQGNRCVVHSWIELCTSLWRCTTSSGAACLLAFEPGAGVRESAQHNRPGCSPRASRASEGSCRWAKADEAAMLTGSRCFRTQVA